MANTIRLRRGLEADRTTITPAEGEMIYTTDTNSLYIGDGSTAGGVKFDFNLDDIDVDTITANQLDINGTVTADGAPLALNRLASEGDIAQFYKDTVQVGSIGASNGNLYIEKALNTGLQFGGLGQIVPRNGGGISDNTVDLGATSLRFNDIYATNGTIQTSDEREKQDIDVLSDAEHNVAVAAKGLIRKYRWKDAVAEKGEDARIHFGVIAQDLKAAFEAEGLDAGRYAMFIHSEWWETYTDVPAVEAVEAQDAVYDDEGNLVSEAVEAVEAKDAYTRTDTFDTEAEAPEGAVKKDRMGVRYPELLAFIIGAL